MDYQKVTLDNGLRLITTSLPQVQSVCLSIYVGAGSRYESEEKAGLSHFLEHLLFKGTERWATAREIAEAVEGVGGVLNGGTDKEMTVYWAKVAHPHFGIALDVLADMLLRPRLDPAELEKERRVVMEEIDSSFDSPHQRVNLLIDEVLWPDQPLGRDVAGRKETVAGLTRQALREYLEQQYRPRNVVIAVAGNIDPEEVVGLVHSRLKDWKDGLPQPWFPAREEQSAPRVSVEPRHTEQVHLCLGLRGLPHLHPDRFVLGLLNVLLGEGMSSRLFQELREKRGLVYEVSSYVTHFFDTGSLIIYAGTQPGNLTEVIKVLLEELMRLREEEVAEAELSRAKELGKGRLLLRLEDTRNVAGWFGSQELLTQRILTVEEVISEVEQITPQDLRRVAQALFRTDRLNLAVVGPVKEADRLEDWLRL